MKKLLAVSGGVDSMVLFDYFVQETLNSNGNLDDIIVAHFNHGTRPSAYADQAFVEKTCKKAGVKFVPEKMLLGENVSEDAARKVRYEFLFRTAEKYHAVIYTAHHLDDLIESIAINLIRGTGWRGITPMQNPLISRPFLDKKWAKTDILSYAAKRRVVFRADPTNSDEAYLRNRVRIKLAALPSKERKKLYHEMNILYQNQSVLREEIEEILRSLAASSRQYPRAWFLNEADSKIQLEILREILLKSNISATRPQLMDFLNAIRTYAPEKSFNLPGDRLVKIHKTYFVV